MQPLIDFRNELYNNTLNSRKVRNYKRRTGRVSYAKGDVSDDSHQEAKHIPGPYLLKHRKEWVSKLLKIQRQLAESSHAMQLIKTGGAASHSATYTPDYRRSQR